MRNEVTLNLICVRSDTTELINECTAYLHRVELLDRSVTPSPSTASPAHLMPPASPGHAPPASPGHPLHTGSPGRAAPASPGRAPPASPGRALPPASPGVTSQTSHELEDTDRLLECVRKEGMAVPIDVPPMVAQQPEQVVPDGSYLGYALHRSGHSISMAHSLTSPSHLTFHLNKSV